MPSMQSTHTLDAVFMDQAIRNPFGVSAFGSAIVRVAPDTVSIKFAVKRTAQHPKNAFQEVRAASWAVQAYLKKAKLTEFGSLRQVTLAVGMTGQGDGGMPNKKTA